jgi:hypothetical protein
LTEHKLTMSEIEFQAQDTVDPIGEEMHDTGAATLPAWKSWLLSGVADNFYCRVLLYGRGRYMMIGRQSDRTAAVEMFRYLVGLGEDLAKKAQADYRSSREVIEFAQTWGSMYGVSHCQREIVNKVMQYKKSFLVGYSTALNERLKVTRKTLTIAATPQASGLILRDAAAVEKFYHEQHPNVRAGRSRSVSLGSTSGYSAGRAAGSSASLQSRRALGC